MAIRTEHQAVITCDSCGNNWVEADYTQDKAKKAARKEGWSIGKYTTCPECIEATK